MFKKLIVSTALIFSLFVSGVYAADVKLAWDPPSTGIVVGYKLYTSNDIGDTWSTGLDVGNVLTYTLPVDDHKLILIKVSAYNNAGESIRTEAGVWYNSDWQKPGPPKTFGLDDETSVAGN